MSLFRRSDPPERPVACTSEEYERLMKTLGRIDAQVESLETKWKLWKTEADRLLARLERREQRARARAEAEGNGQPPDTNPHEIDRLIAARRGRGIPR
jgi:chromosome segregation ATPase